MKYPIYYWTSYGLSPVTELRFSPPRRWRFDFAWPDKKIAVEIDGGVWIQGRHTRGSGFVKDMEKFNTATLLGWKVLKFTPQDLKKGVAQQTVLSLIKSLS